MIVYIYVEIHDNKYVMSFQIDGEIFFKSLDQFPSKLRLAFEYSI